MNIIAVDDEKLVLNALVGQIQSAEIYADVKGFDNAIDALLYAKENKIDIAFLDVEMRETDGITLAEQIGALYSDCRILFVTGFSQYAVDAFRLHACGYLLKPTSAETIKNEIERLRTPLPPLGVKPIQVHTFGNFDVFTKDGAVQFARNKSKELLAYLIDRRGASCTTKEIAAVLWEDKPYDNPLKNYYQSVVSDMLSALKKYGAEAMVVRKWNSIAIDIRQFDCDYYDFLRGNESARKAYQGEYMSNYSWGEFTAANLNNAIEKN